MLQAVGHPVQRLRRIGYAGVLLGRLEAGALRPLTGLEVAALRRAVRGGAASPKPVSRARTRL